MIDRVEVAERVRRGCIEAALAAYEDAGIQGLCGEGRWEYAIDALRGLDLAPIVDGQASGEVAGGAGEGV